MTDQTPAVETPRPADPAGPADNAPVVPSEAIDPDQYMTYEEFGRAFFEVAVTAERLGAALGALAGEAFQVGPIPAGPGGMVKVRADVQVHEPAISRQLGDLITFTVRLPLTIGLLIDLKLDRLHYDVAGLITLPLTVRCARPLQLRIEVEPPRPSDVFVDVASRNMRGELIRNLAQVDAEIRRVIARTVAQEIEKPEARKARFIDVSAELSRALEGDAGAAADEPEENAEPETAEPSETAEPETAEPGEPAEPAMAVQEPQPTSEGDA